MSDAPERISLMPSDGWSWCEGRPVHEEDAIEYIRADKVAALVDAAGKLLAMIDALKAESGRGIDYGEEDAFRMGEWFEAEEDAEIEQARAALAALDAKP